MSETITFNRQKDKIAIIAPSSGCSDDKEKLAAGIKLLEDKGFKCKYDKNILSGNEKLAYFASSKEQRLHELKTALIDDETKIIWAFRGGYGASEIVFDFLNFNLTTPKILIGFSDITALHLLFFQQFNMSAIHGSVLSSLLDLQPEMLDPIISVLSGNEMNFALIPININQPKNIPINAEIVGGNLTIICHMIGSNLTINTEDKIIFVEDVNEKGYHIHRHLMQMKNAALFSKAKALILGDFSNSDELLDCSIEAFCHEHLSIPVFRTQGIGHLTLNYPVVIGGKAIINNNNLKIESPFKLI